MHPGRKLILLKLNFAKADVVSPIRAFSIDVTDAAMIVRF